MDEQTSHIWTLVKEPARWVCSSCWSEIGTNSWASAVGAGDQCPPPLEFKDDDVICCLPVKYLKHDTSTKHCFCERPRTNTTTFKDSPSKRFKLTKQLATTDWATEGERFRHLQRHVLSCCYMYKGGCVQVSLWWSRDSNDIHRQGIALKRGLLQPKSKRWRHQDRLFHSDGDDKSISWSISYIINKKKKKKMNTVFIVNICVLCPCSLIRFRGHMHWKWRELINALLRKRRHLMTQNTLRIHSFYTVDQHR